MKIAIVQPYFMPYLGYFQLVHAVDKFVFFDDVNFIKKGWINRNYIYSLNGPHLFTVPLVKASQNKLINDICISDFELFMLSFKERLRHSYHKAPFYSQVMDWLEGWLFRNDFLLISLLSATSIQKVFEYLDLKKEFIFSSEIDYQKSKTDNTATDKIISICKLLGAKHYINPRNGKDIYKKADFESQNLKLSFINMKPITYTQFDREFMPYLSIIDVLMFNDKEHVKKLLTEYIFE
ncbi:MAG: WbqC family protein [Chitinophagaceae bacterium]|nr:WbqC family protein [Chitinophagaceae bacterium]